MRSANRHLFYSFSLQALEIWSTLFLGRLNPFPVILSFPANVLRVAFKNQMLAQVVAYLPPTSSF